ncbi:hypothetical protein [Paracoccus mutanolyticus]|nr:hypothetical protein [Paracoccus mutanolyticus]
MHFEHHRRGSIKAVPAAARCQAGISIGMVASAAVPPLEGYGTDRVGRSGLTGKVKNHTASRFGSAALVSVIGLRSGLQRN